MTEYFFLFMACAFFSLQFIFQKLFQRDTLGGFSVSMWNQVVACLIGVLFLVVKSGGNMASWVVTAPALLYAILYAASGLACSVASLAALGCGKVSVMTTFCLAGGMIVPFVYGIAALGENAGLFKWLGMLVLCVALVPSVMQDKGAGGKISVKFALYCLIVFLTNGLVSVFSKMHQISPAAMKEDGFVFLTGTIRLCAALVILLALFARRRARGERDALRETFWEIGREKMTGKLFFLLIVFAGTNSVCNTLGNLFSLKCMVTMDASIQFPILSAVVIVLTALFGRIFFGEKINRASALSLLLSVVGIGLFMIP